MTYTIHLTASSEDNACHTDNFFPAFTATCSNAILWMDREAPMSISTTTSIADNDSCTYLDKQTLFCNNSVHQVHVMCHGDTIDNLHLHVAVEKYDSYVCDKQMHHWASSNDNDWRSKTIYGGAATHTVKLTSTCPQDDEPVVLKEYQQSNDCLTEYTCTKNEAGIVASCQGDDTCQLDVNAFDVKVENIPAGCIHDLNMQVKAGGACDHNFQCLSSVCHRQACVSEKLSDGTPDCKEHDDCQSGVCASVSALDTGSFQCCPSDASNVQDPVTGRLICGGQPGGALCLGDAMCQSEVCLFGKCVADKVLPHEPCERHHQCTTNACVKTGPRDTLSCCPTSGTVEINGQYVCLS